MEIVIRRTEVKDVDGLCELYSQPQAQAQTLQLPILSRALWEKRLSAIPDNVYSYVALIDGKIVGNIGFEHVTRPRTQHVAHFGMGVHDDYHGRGVGSKLLETVLDLADNWLNVRRIEIDAFVDNHAALRLYKKFGFVIEGEAIDSAFRNGEFINTYYLARINRN
ncbi:GNAT family N-acetyltransferase [Aliivibrio fischeri]|uniref:GNAT family N-acetyltransferase n=1 Tax=Aliivibrio fischeri TaxID=668 RepID=UPI00107E73E6|nr:GNAT family N-acetyltransferase [Aliivibrio fischeri]TGA68373.1 GNAT family N-acetyltransferase [Aliivibrio fischeri]